MKELFDEFGHGSLARLPMHRNPGLEIVYLRHGQVVWKCEGRTETVSPDSLYFTLPWQTHGSFSEFEPGHEWFFVVIRLKGKQFDQPAPFGFLDVLHIDPAVSKEIESLLRRTLRHTWPATPIARLLLPGLVAELERPGRLHRERVLHLTSLLVVELASIIGSAEGSKEKAMTDRLAGLLAELERDCAEPWTLAQMAGRVGLKRTQFEALFHHGTGDRPLQHLQRLRVKKACGLLRSTKEDITGIALDCGFASSQHLANVFRKFTNVTPSHYRRFGGPEILLPRKQIMD
jgi:AraC-like DNA-binding protein